MNGRLLPPTADEAVGFGAGVRAAALRAQAIAAVDKVLVSQGTEPREVAANCRCWT